MGEKRVGIGSGRMTAQRAVGASNDALPDPAEIRTLDDIADYLRQLRAWAGNVSYAELVRRINKRRGPREQARLTTVYDCFRLGRKRLDVELALDIAAALGLDELGRLRLRRALTAAHEAVDGIAGVRVPRQLPAPPRMFTGRARELAELDRPPDTSTVVVTAIDGMPGIGKTALAVHAARKIADRYPDGQLFIDLHGHTQGMEPIEPGEALDHLLRALGVPGTHIPASLDERAALYRTRLADQQVLIVLDNAAAETQVQPLLPGSPGCLVLVTSRRRLAGLDHARTLSLETLPAPDAVTLLIHTAGEDRLAGQQPELLAELVELCGRLPLAIRIAAARLRSHPAWDLAHLVERLRDQRRRLIELEAGQRSPTAALDLSYQHLSLDQQRTYRLLGLHPGPDIDSYATAALLDSTLLHAGRMLDQLFDAHLLLEPVAGRYRFHDLTRAHGAHTAARDQTQPTGRAGLNRLLDYYQHTAAVAMDVAYPHESGRRPQVPPASSPTPDLPDPTSALGWLDTELPNLLATAEQATTHDRPDHTVALSAILYRHLRVGGHNEPAQRLHQHALDTARAVGDRTGELHALVNLGDTLGIRGEMERADDSFRQGLAIARGVGDVAGEVAALLGLGGLAYYQARHEPATDHFEHALQIARTAGQTRSELRALGNLGHIHRLRGRLEPATTCYQEALTIARAIGDRNDELKALVGLGHMYRLRDRPDAASDTYREALAVARAIGDREAELHALWGVGTVHRTLGRHRAAIACFDQLLELARRTGNRNSEFEACHGLGHAHRTAGRPEPAITHHELALRLAREMRQPDDEARAHDGLALAHRALGHREEAGEHWHAALAILTDLGLAQVEEVKTDITRAHLAELERVPPG
jgi:tetratricopeptide (TPR) repeat protein